MRKHLLVRREGLTLFDEDDVCSGFRDPDTIVRTVTLCNYKALLYWRI